MPENKGDLLRGVPAAILIALVVQFGSTIWWAAAMNTRLDQQDRIVSALLARIERLEAAQQRMLADMATALTEIRHINRRDRDPPT